MGFLPMYRPRNFASVPLAIAPASAVAPDGINDCEAKIARMSLRDVWAMMHPLEGELDACV